MRWTTSYKVCSRSKLRRIPELGNLVQTDKSTPKDVAKSLVKNFPLLEKVIDDIIPKKSTAYTMKLKENDKSELFIVDNTVLAFKKGKAWVPVLQIVHKCQLTRPITVQNLPSRPRRHQVRAQRRQHHVPRIHFGRRKFDRCRTR